MWQAVYTAGVVVPTPISKARYYHRNMNPKKLIEVKYYPKNFIAIYKINILLII